MPFTYKNLQEVHKRHIVTDEELDRHIQQLVQQNPRIAEVSDRPTQKGDEVVLNYAGFCDGVQFPGGTAEKQTLVLGSGMFIPGFEEQLIDKMPGEKVDVKVKFPDAYHAPDLAGKEAVFKCELLSIRLKTPYEADDTFAKEVGGCESFAEFRHKLRQQMQQFSDQRGEMDLQDRLLKQAAETLEYTPTQEELDEAVNQQMKAFEAQLQQQGLTLEMYCSFMTTNEQELLKDMEPSARAQLRQQKAIDEIAKLENLQVSDEELGQATALVARQNNMTVEELKPYYTAQFREALVQSVLTGKVMSLIRENANVTEE
ncbi:MAG: trigger factor [Oscillospiraceae bacterium]|nr:trigger factor [Oscillospiraceae bacterium]